MKNTLTVEQCSIGHLYITKQLEYVTKDHIAIHTILNKLKTTLFFSFLVVNCLNNILLITWSCFSVAQASSSFNCLDMCMPTRAAPTFITEVHFLVTQVQLIYVNDRYRELTPYTVLANSHLFSFHDAYQCQGHAH